MTILVTPVHGTLALDVVEEGDFLLLLNQFDPLPRLYVRDQQYAPVLGASTLSVPDLRAENLTGSV